MRGLFMSLVIHDWMGDVQDSQDVSASKMTYIVSGGALNSTYSLTLERGNRFGDHCRTMGKMALDAQPLC